MTDAGLRFPTESTTSTARDVLADALRKADPVGARAVEQETNWRRNYLAHYVRAVEAGIGDAAAARRIAHDGLRSAQDQMRFGDGPLTEAIDSAPLAQMLKTTPVDGGAEPETELSVPYRGERLRGAALEAQLVAWLDNGIITPSCADAVRTVMANPEWLRLEGDTVVVLGAGAEMGPLRALQRWGAETVAIDLPREDLQERLVEQAREGAGRTHLPARIVTKSSADTGADLLVDLPAIAEWLDHVPGRLVLGNYCYADGATHVLVSMAADALAAHLLKHRPDTGLSFLATPTDVYVVAEDEIRLAEEKYGRRSLTRAPLRVVSGGRLLQRHYAPGARIGTCDALVPQQGPNYALAKRLQRWRATDAIAAGARVSLNVAPATRTRSVLKNKALAAAYSGAHRFGVEVFDPATSNVLMAALLVHDLRADQAPSEEPWQDEHRGAAHGGLWTAAYHPRSALGLAAVLGIGALRG
ncbi:hypothetical protein [Aeromicrobium sp. Leaf350]|uniref:hypothetical protein n=1 Tax=Aeromicrobium sp. Leaf350 TaxID=2876565 RepID=UPI001E31DC1C|nr:hypothetical protein [Aeromicrobium sp. Leaf350]